MINKAKERPIDISDLKLMLGYQSIAIKDDLLTLLKKRAMTAIAVYVGRSPDRFPNELEFIADELVASRLTMLNSEGLKTESTDISRYDYVDDIYKNWYNWLDDWRRKEESNGKNRVRMIQEVTLCVGQTQQT